MIFKYQLKSEKVCFKIDIINLIHIYFGVKCLLYYFIYGI